MSLNVISLSDLFKASEEEDIKKLLFSFVTLKTQDSVGADDVEYFILAFESENGYCMMVKQMSDLLPKEQ